MNIDERLNKIEDSLSNINLILEALTKKPEVIPSTHEKMGEMTKNQAIPFPAVHGKMGEWAKFPQETTINQAIPFPETPNPVVEVPNPVVEVPNPTIEVPIELMNLLNSKEWPAAVDPALICDITSDQDKEDRAEGILDLIIDTHLENLKFLDFGCGEGHVINKSKLQKPTMSVGFDIKKHDKWDKWSEASNTMLTTDWNKVKSFGPYNIVLMYDVIDHMLLSDEETISILKEIKNLLAPNGKVYVRCHPWCSRHGTHLYHKLNKAFTHLVFSNEELEVMGYKQDQIRKVTHPQNEYGELFKKSGLTIKGTPSLIKEAVEKFFIEKPVIAERIKKNYKNSSDFSLKSGKLFPVFQLEQQFIDYVLF